MSTKESRELKYIYEKVSPVLRSSVSGFGSVLLIAANIGAKRQGLVQFAIHKFQNRREAPPSRSYFINEKLSTSSQVSKLEYRAPTLRQYRLPANSHQRGLAALQDRTRFPDELLRWSSLGFLNRQAPSSSQENFRHPVKFSKPKVH